MDDFPYYCDEFQVDMYDDARGGVRIGTMRYVHSWAYNPLTVSRIQRGPGSVIYSFYMGYMTYDLSCQGGAGWNGYHVHEDAYYQQNVNSPVYGSTTHGVYCSPAHPHTSDNCYKPRTNDRTAWTRSWHW
jgi:hypothetical protein